MRGSFQIARVGGIPIRLHFTFLLILPVIAVSFSRTFAGFRDSAVLAGIPPRLVQGSPLLWGALTAIALFVSVLIHELAHAVYAVRTGGKVRDITLLMIGGVTSLQSPPRKPLDEAAMALVGPLTSFVLGGLSYALYGLLGGTSLVSPRFALFYLASLNIILGVFNLIPAFPMDGGRILRGLLAVRMGTVGATRVAATLGKIAALLFVALSFVTFNFVLMIIAFFIYIGAEAEAQQVLAQSVLGRIPVRELLEAAPEPLAADASVDEAIARMLATHQLALLVQGPGVVRLEDLERIPADRRATRRVIELAQSAPPVSAASSVWDALREMNERKLPLLPVAGADGQLAGVLTREAVIRCLRLSRKERPPRARPFWSQRRTV